MIDPALVERFETPPSEYGPTPLWWWSGGTVTEEGIAWQLQRFADGRILNLVLMNLAPKGPTYGAQPDDPVWFSERWWELFRFTCDRARELGIRLWFYDQIGFSGANLQGLLTARHPEFAGRALVSRIVEVGAGGAVALEPREHLIGVYDERRPDGGEWHRHDVVDGHVGAQLEGTAMRVVAWRETAFDYLSTEAVDVLIDHVHGEYERRVPEHVGTTIVGSFQDELPAMPTWSETFAERFRAETGYDLLAELPALWDHESTAAPKIRADYHRVRTQLAEEAFFRPLGEWHRTRGMLIGADQMNPARAGVPTQSTQLYGDYIATHRWFDAVGSDHEGDARIHSSIADLYDHPRVWIESFHSSGWGGTLEDTWDWLIPFFRSGANLYNPHASYYGLQAGWFEWAPPSTDFRQPYYAVYSDFATAVARVSALMTWGRHAVEVALLYPSQAVQSELPPDLPIDHFLEGDIGPEYPGVDLAQRTYMALAGKNDWFRAAPGLLDLRGIDFDVIDDDSIARSTATDGVLDVNEFRFGTVILPSVSRITGEVATRLVELLEAGGRVIAVGSVPSGASGRDPDGCADAAVTRLAAHERLERVSTPEAAAAALDGPLRFARGERGIRAQRQGDHGLALVPGAFPNATAYPLRTGDGAGGWDDIDFDAERYDDRSSLQVVGVVAEAEIWNPATGSRTPAAVTVSADGTSSTIDVDSAGAPMVLAVWRTTLGPVDEAQVQVVPAAVSTPVETTWSQEIVPTLDNRWGDFAMPAGPDEIPVEVWRVDLLEGEKRTPMRVTVGQEVLVSGAFDTEAPGDDAWRVQRYSTSVGRDGALGAPQDPKGFIAEEFVTHDSPAPGEQVAVRAYVRIAEPGDYELTISSACPTRAWLDGRELDFGGATGYDATARVHFADRVGLLEYHLGSPARPLGRQGTLPPKTTSSFTLDRPDERAARPEFMGGGTAGVRDGSVTFRRTFRLQDPAASAVIVTGAPNALTVTLDGETVARQEKVEYYESGLGDNPMYFTHELGPVAAGDHVVEVVTSGVVADTPLFVDLVLEMPTASEGRPRRTAVPSGLGWTAGDGDAPVILLPALTGSTVHARAARRPHPLAAAHWLSGQPEIGTTAVPFETSASTTSAAQAFELMLPAGTASVTLSTDPARVELDGSPVPFAGRQVTPAEPTREPSILSVAVAPRAFSAAGAAWDGPVAVHTVSTPARFEDWADQGLESWSGAVRYRSAVSTSVGEVLRLDLGRVRGAVVVEVDGVRVASAFCAPFAFTLPSASPGEHEVAFTVYGTLGPRYAAATQSTFTKPSQLRTGVMGPVLLERVEDGSGSARAEAPPRPAHRAATER